MFQSLCRNKFCLWVHVSCLLVSVLYPFFSLTPGTVLLKYLAVLLNAFSRVESVLGRSLCLVMLAKRVRLFIWHQLFKQKKEQDDTISGQPFLDSSQGEFRASISSFVPSWKKALCALLTSVLAYLMYRNWWADLSLCARSVPLAFPLQVATA